MNEKLIFSQNIKFMIQTYLLSSQLNTPELSHFYGQIHQSISNDF